MWKSKGLWKLRIWTLWNTKKLPQTHDLELKQGPAQSSSVPYQCSLRQIWESRGNRLCLIFTSCSSRCCFRIWWEILKRHRESLGCTWVLSGGRKNCQGPWVRHLGVFFWVKRKLQMDFVDVFEGLHGWKGAFSVFLQLFEVSAVSVNFGLPLKRWIIFDLIIFKVHKKGPYEFTIYKVVKASMPTSSEKFEKISRLLWGLKVWF